MSTAIVLLGPPGVGKGTQGAWLADALSIPEISTGEIFRENVEQQTELGRLADIFISQGEFVPDTVTTPMVAARLDAPDAAAGFVLDGYPRTVDQAVALRGILEEQGRKLDVVLELSAPQDVLLGRLMHRAAEEGRADDREEVFARRLEIYRDRTEPLAAHYEERGLLEVVDASGDREEVFEAMMAALRSRGIGE